MGAVEVRAGDDREGGAEQRALGAMAGFAVLEPPGDQRGAPLGEPEQAVTQLVPSRAAPLLLEEPQGGALRGDIAGVPVALGERQPAVGDALDARRREGPAVLQQAVDGGLPLARPVSIAVHRVLPTQASGSRSPSRLPARGGPVSGGGLVPWRDGYVPRVSS